MIRNARRAAALLLLTSALLISCARKADKPATPAAPPAIVLISGHEPFGGLTKNTSWQVARRLKGETIAGLEVVAVRLPVVWEECGRQIREAIRRHRPRMVLATGVAWMGLVQVETTARNERRKYKDNRDELPRAKVIETGGPERIATRLPVEAIVKRLAALGLPVATSDDAGGYLCNETFYSLLRETARLEAETGETIPAGFIHLPRALADRARDPKPAEKKVRAVTVDELAAGMRAVIEEMVAAKATSPQVQER